MRRFEIVWKNEGSVNNFDGYEDMNRIDPDSVESTIDCINRVIPVDTNYRDVLIGVLDNKTQDIIWVRKF